ncbi:MAG TPA: hypothetical protein P5279_11035 [Anaerohalosphaeraceae bacterium]|jgi:hypothetical protein|nr:hypothetical protein [Anaerohalosphaeraceae bacterium]HRT51020.1 hypothetical protein [Anaerohalosphaeraceae bacterium]HRT87006.1 hypothetical protein [Anaerohalosphaeraceae bacterium]
MKKTLILAAGLLIMAAGAYVAFAQRTQEPPAGQAPGRGQRSAWAARRPYGRMAMCPLHCAMVRAMTAKEMEVTGNGEIIVLVGCQLFKFDPNLNLVAKTQVEVDTEALQKKMQQMMENCPIRQQIQQDNDYTDDNGNQN